MVAACRGWHAQDNGIDRAGFGMNVRTTITIVLLGAAAALTACGRKGDLDTPYQAAVDARKEAERNNEPLPPAPKEPVKDRAFFLDPLI